MSASVTREVQVTFDCADPDALCLFWAEVLGYQQQPPPEGFDDWDSFLESVGVPPAERNERILVTTLTKKMSEDLTDYLLDAGVRTRYLHSEVDTLKRIELLRDLRLGDYDVLVGIKDRKSVV